MRPLSTRASRITGLFAVVFGVVALLALPGIAAAKHHHGGRHNSHHSARQLAHSSSVQEAQESGGTTTTYDPTTGRLTIGLAEGESVTGLVTEETEIKCGSNQGGDRSEGAGDDEGGEEPGDDNSDEGDEQSGDGGGGDSGGAWGGDGAGQMGEEPTASTCGTESLTPGVVIGSAELRLEGGKLVFTEIDLGSHS